MARTIDSFKSTCLISTIETLMPHASVAVSMVFWMSAFSISRSASSVSRSCLPSTARSVVCASWLVACRKSTTWMIAFCGSTTRKYTTAFTFTDTLSRVMTSCGGTSSTTVRRSTLTICCTIGMRKKRPGPFTFQKRPSWNTTARWYSRSTRIEKRRSRTARRTTPEPNSIMGMFLRRFRG